jgi:hypothetical protein
MEETLHEYDSNAQKILASGWIAMRSGTEAVAPVPSQRSIYVDIVQEPS